MDELLAFCRRVLGDGERAEEAAAAAAAAAPTNDRIASLAAAAQACRERAEENGAAAPIAVGEPAGLADAVAHELTAATARLPERQREVLALRELLRLSYEQIGRVMGIDAAAVAPLLARSRLRLRAERRGSAGLAIVGCADTDRALRVLACRQDSEPLSHQDDEWLLAHLAGCADCGMAHAAMLEASVCYRAWP